MRVNLTRLLGAGKSCYMRSSLDSLFICIPGLLVTEGVLTGASLSYTELK